MSADQKFHGKNACWQTNNLRAPESMALVGADSVEALTSQESLCSHFDHPWEAKNDGERASERASPPKNAIACFMSYKFPVHRNGNNMQVQDTCELSSPDALCRRRPKWRPIARWHANRGGSFTPRSNATRGIRCLGERLTSRRVVAVILERGTGTPACGRRRRGCGLGADRRHR